MYLIAITIIIFGEIFPKMLVQGRYGSEEGFKKKHRQITNFCNGLSLIGWFAIPLITIAYGIKLIMG